MNILSIDQLSDGRIKTEIITEDGIEVMELHLDGLHDSIVLKKLQERKYYQQFKGNWVIMFSHPTHRIQRPTFDAAISQAQDYIFTRDNPSHYDDLC